MFFTRSKQLKRSGKLAIAAFLVAGPALAQFPTSEWNYKEASKVMGEGYWKHWTPEVQKKIDADIDRFRKADASLKISNVATGTEVRIEQVAHEFVFGANIFNYDQLGTSERNKRYRNLFGTLFNSATVPFYWKKFEMQPNRRRHAEEDWDTEAYWNRVAEPKKEPHWRRPAPEAILDYLEKTGVRMHGHTMVWGNRNWHHPEWLFDKYAPESEKATIRSWMTEYADEKTGKIYDKFTEAYKALTPAQVAKAIPVYTERMKTIFEERVEELSRHYGGRLQSWDIVNESATDFSLGAMVPGDAISKSHYGIMPGDYTFAAFQTAQKIFPKNVLLNINDYKNDPSYAQQTKDLIKRGSKIDIMGSQMHLFNPQQCLDIADGKAIETPQQVIKKLQDIGQAGLPIHLSEITVTAPGDDAKGRAIQSVIAYNLYRVWFSAEKMMGITWWNIVDDCGAPGEPTTSGIFTRNMEPKPAYYALNQLINQEWKTNLTAKTTADGKVNFRGFKGKYRVTWKDKDGGYHDEIFELKQNGDGLK